MNEPIFEQDDIVIAFGIRGYENHLTEGKPYIVLKYEAPMRMACGFTFPAYVTVVGNMGKPVLCHASRFKQA